MPTIPQELVEVILADFDPVVDRASLESVALTAINFAGPAQRVLFRSLGIHGHQKLGSFDRAFNLLAGSPHIGPYVKDLTIKLPLKAALEHHHLLERLLPQFSNVRRCVLNGVGVSWDDLQPALQSALTAFILRGTLDKLHLLHITNLPAGLIPLIAQTTPVLSLQNVFIKRGAPFSQGEQASSEIPHLTHLMLSSPHGMQSHLCQQLTSPSCTANLLRLAVDQGLFADDLLHAVAPTLKELSLNCTGTHQPFTLPSLPHLVTLELQIAPSWVSMLPEWLPVALASLPDSVPALRTLTVRIALPVLDAYARKQDLALLATPGTTAVLAAVDTVLHGAVSLCVWELTMAEPAGAVMSAVGNSTVGAHSALVFARFRAAVEKNVTRMCAEGTLEIRYAQRMGYVESLP
ncbi:hypothetical protein MSAN_02012100 [Mycena sanguinolenta]|uniref:Uncharacterized protein n=1 Tax=Mycena sanguinolenta TaxID=230812 RepID=A0A8H6XJ85_9AGAR|nr:hypothetical protein MSAN_02012100 [Mycena sanguinolenta]